MPVVDGKKYAYTKKGKAQAARASGKKAGKSGAGRNKPDSSSVNAGNMRGGQPKGTK